jgi:hypothetical protein
MDKLHRELIRALREANEDIRSGLEGAADVENHPGVIFAKRKRLEEREGFLSQYPEVSESDLRKILDRLVTWGEARPRIENVTKKAHAALQSLPEAQRNGAQIADAIAELHDLLYDLGLVQPSTVGTEPGELVGPFAEPLY